jgi:hypothetical protein
MSDGAKFIESIGKGDRLAIRREIEKLVAKTAEAVTLGEEYMPLWGITGKLSPDSIHTAVGILMELLRLRTRNWSSLGAMFQLSAILKEEKITNRKILDKSERNRIQKLLMGYIFRHPRDNYATSHALSILYEELETKPLYRRAINLCAKRKIFAPKVRQRVFEILK